MRKTSATFYCNELFVWVWNVHFQNETNISWPYFWMIFFRVIITGIKVVTKFPCPRTLRLDVTWQEVLVWRWGQRERVKLLGPKRSARETDPLSRQVFEVRWAVELDPNDVWRQKFCFHDVERHVLCAKTYHLKRWTNFPESSPKSEISKPTSGRIPTVSGQLIKTMFTKLYYIITDNLKRLGIIINKQQNEMDQTHFKNK